MQPTCCTLKCLAAQHRLHMQLTFFLPNHTFCIVRCKVSSHGLDEQSTCVNFCTAHRQMRRFRSSMDVGSGSRMRSSSASASSDVTGANPNLLLHILATLGMAGITSHTTPSSVSMCSMPCQDQRQSDRQSHSNMHECSGQNIKHTAGLLPALD